MTDAAEEAANLINELVAMAKDDPLRETINAACFLDAGQRARSREIGQRLNEIGGFDLMLLAHESVRFLLEQITPSASHLVRGLEMAWHDIGEWRD